MDRSAKKFFKDILETPSPSGYEQPVQDLVRQYVGGFADEVRTDLHGNVIACCNPDAPLRLMFAGHADQIGLIVSHINENGYIYTNTIGGWDPQQLVGQRMTIYTAGGLVPAVIARKPIHLLDQDERKQVVKQKELWLDIGAKDRDEAVSVVAIGDPVTLELGYQEMRNQLANSPGMDNKTGLWVSIEALRRAHKREGLKVAVYAVSTVQEEIGLRGAITSAYGVNPHVGVAIDVTHATDCPTIDKTQEGDVKLGGGPVIYRGPNMNPIVVQRLRAAAESAKITVQWGASGRWSTTTRQHDRHSQLARHSENRLMADIQAGIVGCGFEGLAAHVPAFRAFEQTRFVALADTDTQCRVDTVSSCQVPSVYADYERVSHDPKVQLVVIAAPTTATSPATSDHAL